jgi:hypothetical protein
MPAKEDLPITAMSRDDGDAADHKGNFLILETRERGAATPENRNWSGARELCNRCYVLILMPEGLPITAMSRDDGDVGDQEGGGAPNPWLSPATYLGQAGERRSTFGGRVRLQV